MKKPVENLEKRKVTGGRRRPHRGRRKYEKDGYPIETELGPVLLVKRRVRGGGVKLGLKRGDYANVTDPETKETKKVKILKVIANPASRDYERRGVITKGAIIRTELGDARVTSRPSQHGIINAVLIKRTS